MGSEFFKYIAKIYISSDGCVTQVWVTTEYFTWKSSCFSQCYGGVLSLNILLQKTTKFYPTRTTTTQCENSS